MSKYPLHPGVPTASSLPSLPDPNASDAELVRRVREGEYAAFERVFRTYYADLVAFAEYFVPAWVAEEVVQEAMLSLWERHAGWRVEGSLKPFLFGCVKREAIDAQRRSRRRGRYVAADGLPAEPTSDEGPEQAYRLVEARRTLARAVEAMPERRRLIFRLVREQGLSYAEVAAILDVSTGTVKKQMWRAARHLRDRLAPLLCVLLLAAP